MTVLIAASNMTFFIEIKNRQKQPVSFKEKAFFIFQLHNAYISYSHLTMAPSQAHKWRIDWDGPDI